MLTTERQPEEAISSEDAVNLEEAEVQPTSRRVAYKSALAAVVVGVITISGLWLFVLDQEGNKSDTVPVPEPHIQTQEATDAIGTGDARTEDKYDQIDRRLTSLSGRIDRGIETQQSHSTEVKRTLTTMAESVRAVKVVITDLLESNKELSRRISDAISRLDTLIKDVRKRKVVQRKPAARPKPRPAKTPPFHVDAIDVWDDATYVAISQAGRVAFLKTGERQSGWTVARIDRLKEWVEFKGPVGQHHLVSLPR